MLNIASLYCFTTITMLQLTSEQTSRLEETIANLSSGNICALDESVGSANKMLEKLGLPANEETRREYRRILFATNDFGSLYKGSILTTELMDATVAEGSDVTFPELLEKNGQTTVVKIDLGMREAPGFSGGKIIKGVETMAKDLQTYYDRSGGRVSAAKARQELRVGESDYVIEHGMDNLAQMAAECQNFQHSILLLLEPEVLRTGNHNIDEHSQTSKKALDALDKYLDEAGVHKNLIAIKTNAITEGEKSATQASPEVVGSKTIQLWQDAIDDQVKLVLMLSGGLSDVASTEYFNAIVKEAKERNARFAITSSFGRAAHRKPVEIWSKNQIGNVDLAQESFTTNAVQNELARKGEYVPENDPRR
jgi:fructose-bisphosphate aldolase class I